jgi:hypothetical protein
VVRERPSPAELRAEELAGYCREVDLAALAFSLGYRPYGRPGEGAAPAGRARLRHAATQDELTVWRDGDGIWRYASTADGTEGCTVIEFLLKRRGLGIGYVLKDLRWWVRERGRRAGRGRRT